MWHFVACLPSSRLSRIIWMTTKYKGKQILDLIIQLSLFNRLNKMLFLVKLYKKKFYQILVCTDLKKVQILFAGFLREPVF